MTLLILIPLVFYVRFSDNATLGAIVFTIGNGILSAVEGFRFAFILGEAIRTTILSGLYFGFLVRLDKDGWVYWVVLVVGGILLAVVS
jgi:hypothetical protein